VGPNTAGTQPPASTVPGTPPPRRYRPPAIPFTSGQGAPIGAMARLVYTTTTFSPLPLGFIAGSVRVGTRAGLCRVPVVTAGDRAGITAAARRQTHGGTVAALRDESILLADCGAEGRWALVTWTQRIGSDETRWVDDMRDDDAGRWSGTARGVQPGCRVPLEAAAAWQLDVTICPPPPPRPRTPAPRRPGPGPGPLDRLPEGTSRA
jgi:hypothetical protein